MMNDSSETGVQRQFYKEPIKTLYSFWPWQRALVIHLVDRHQLKDCLRDVIYGSEGKLRIKPQTNFNQNHLIEWDLELLC